MSLFSNWFDNIRVWKLNTVGDAIGFGVLVLAGAIIFWLVIRRIKYNRRPDIASRRVAKKLKKLGGRQSRVYMDFVLRTPEGSQPFDMLWVVQSRLYTVKVIPQGTRIYGSKKGVKWTLSGSVSEYIDNPLPGLEKSRQILIAFFEGTNYSDIAIEPLVVCADTYETPRIKIDGFKSAVALKQLRLWKKNLPINKNRFYDTEGLCTQLEQAMVPAHKEN